MAGFGTGVINGFINTYTGLKRLDQEDRKIDQADMRMENEQRRLNEALNLRKKEEEREAYNFQRRKDLQNMNLLTAAIASGQDIGESGWEMYQDVQTRMPMFSEVGRKSGAMDAAFKVLKSVGPDSVNDPAAVSALSSVLTMGADPEFIKSVSLDQKKPGVVLATGKDGIKKEYTLGDLEKHVDYAERMRAISKSREFKSGIKMLREAYGFDKKATAVFKEIYNDKGQKQLARIDPQSGELLGYIGGAKPASKPKGNTEDSKLYKVTDADGNERWLTREQAVSMGQDRVSQDVLLEAQKMAEAEAQEKARWTALDSTDFPGGRESWINNRAMQIAAQLTGKHGPGIGGVGGAGGGQELLQSPAQGKDYSSAWRQTPDGAEKKQEQAKIDDSGAKEPPQEVEQQYIDAARRLKESLLLEENPSTGLWAALKRANSRAGKERFAPTTKQLAEKLPPLIQKARNGDAQAQQELRKMAVGLPDDVLAKLIKSGVIN